MKQEQLEAEHDATEVAPGVVRIQLPIMLPGLGHVNCYALEDERVDPPHREVIRDRGADAAGADDDRVGALAHASSFHIALSFS